MNKFLSQIYQQIPKRLHKKLGKSRLLRPLRNFFFRSNGTYRETKTLVNHSYNNYNVQFIFFASIQVATKARIKGMENSLLRNSIQLLKKYKPKLEDNYHVFDIGTNFGYLSLVWANSVCAHGKVYSFEPHPYLFKSFLKSISANSIENLFSAENMALGREKKTIQINFASTTSNVLDFENWHQQNLKKLPVEMTTLDLYSKSKNINQCDLIKIDVDGIEIDILEGSKEMIQKFRPIIIVETNLDHRIVSFFKKNNYASLDMNLKPYYEGDPLPGNVFFVPNELYLNVI